MQASSGCILSILVASYRSLSRYYCAILRRSGASSAPNCVLLRRIASSCNDLHCICCAQTRQFRTPRNLSKHNGSIKTGPSELVNRNWSIGTGRSEPVNRNWSIGTGQSRANLQGLRPPPAPSCRSRRRRRRRRRSSSSNSNSRFQRGCVCALEEGGVVCVCVLAGGLLDAEA